jgi:uncharacterized protein YjbI with pentapeptide repeats
MRISRLLEIIAWLSVPILGVLWLLEADERTKERHYRAWELINSARAPAREGSNKHPGWSGDGGRKDALEDLNRDGVSLAGALLEGAYLPKIDLDGANLVREGAYLRRIDLVRADLGYADLTGAKLRCARLHDANLNAADLRDAKLQGAALFGADLQDANLALANLQGAYLGVDFPGNVESAYEHPHRKRQATNLKRANLTDADLKGADLQSAEGLTQEQVNSAIGDELTQLPECLIRPAHWGKAEAVETTCITE